MDDRQLITTAREAMELYLTFAASDTLPAARRQYFAGAAAAINDLMCRVGLGAKVEDLAEQLQALQL